MPQRHSPSFASFQRRRTLRRWRLARRRRTHATGAKSDKPSPGTIGSAGRNAVVRAPCACAGGPTLKETLMTKTLTALVAAATLASASAVVPTTAQERCIGCGIGGVEYPIAPPGYAYYPAYYEPLPGPNCYWFRVPAYDARGNMVGWRGRPEAFCSWLSGYRPWPPR